jgi:hypothetical protein
MKVSAKKKPEELITLQASLFQQVRDQVGQLLA